MSVSINFVSARRKKLSTAEQQDRKWFSYTVYFFIGCFVLFLAGFGTKFFFARQLDQVLATQELTRQAILAQEELERDYTVFAHKLKQLTLIWGRREEKQEALQFFNNLFSDDIRISGIDYTSSGTQDVLSFSLVAKSVFVLDEVFAQLDSPEVKSRFASVERGGLRRSSEGSYAMQITLTLASRGEK